MKVVKSYMMHINSANRNEGTPYDFTVDVPHEVGINVDKEENQVLKITLFKMSTYLETYNITTGSTDQIIFYTFDGAGNQTGSTTITLSQGNLTYAQMASAITGAYPTCIVSYIARLNKFLFNFGTQNAGLQCVNNSYRQFGFSNNTTIYKTSSIGGFQQLYSENPLKPRSFDKMQIHLKDVMPIASNFINNLEKKDGTGTVMNGKYLQKSNLLASLDINNAPFTLFTYDGSIDNYGLFVSDKRLKKLKFEITNEFNEPLTVLKDSYLILRLDIYEDDINEQLDFMKTVKQMNEWLKIMVLQQNLK